MTDLSSFLKTDLVDDHVANDVNVLIANALRSEYNNTETITATKELTDMDCPYQIITASGADRTVELPPEATSNHLFVIYNAGASNQVLVKDSTSTNVYATLSTGRWGLFVQVQGKGWIKVSPTAPLTTIEGLGLIWNSNTSITVDVGSCYAENGSFIEVTSALVKSALSLSASTWYHVYVYLSSGVPAAEVVTTAPVAWKGSAYSKTGDTSRRYVGSIKSDGSGNVYNFIHNPITNQILYRKIQVNASPFLVLNAGTSSTAAAVSCSGIVPVTTISVVLQLANLADQIMRISEDNGVSSTQFSYILSIGNTVNQRLNAIQTLDGSLQFWYAFNAAVGAGAGYAYVNGYSYNR